MLLELASGPEPFNTMVRHMNKVMDQLQKGFFNFCPAETWTPPVNLYENETCYVLCVDLAGVEKEKIDLAVEDHQVRLRGNRAVPVVGEAEGAEPNQRVRVHMMEIDHGPFCRAVDLPRSVNAASVVATYKDGLLWVRLPKK
jgi:HSP20 family protein